MHRYHRNLGFPKGMQRPTGRVALSYSEHAREAAATDRYGHIELPETLALDNARLVEAYCDGQHRVVCGVWRLRYNEDLDLCIVANVKGWVVRTVWLNERGDTHATLDVSLYSIAV
jgi:hypothetical protein